MIEDLKADVLAWLAEDSYNENLLFTATREAILTHGMVDVVFVGAALTINFLDEIDSERFNFPELYVNVETTSAYFTWLAELAIERGGQALVGEPSCEGMFPENV